MSAPRAATTAERFTIVPGDWAPGGEELTPTLKLERRPIERRYADAIEAMYAEGVRG